MTAAIVSKYGCTTGDGDQLLDPLLRLGSAFEDALADLIATKLRATDISVDRTMFEFTVDTVVGSGITTEPDCRIPEPIVHIPGFSSTSW